MKTSFASKVDWWLLAIVAGVVILSFFPFLLSKEWPMIIHMALLLLFLIAVFLSFRYEIEDNRLRVVSLFFFHKDYDIASITSIRRTRNPLSAPAASLDRLEIRLGKKLLLVSPKRRKDFVKELLLANPQIQISTEEF